MAGAADTTEGLIRRLGLRYAITARAAIAVVCGVLGIFEAPRADLAAVAVAALLAWSACCMRLLPRGQARWLPAVDLLLVALLCLTQRWTVPTEALEAGQGWVLPVASIGVVACQWHTKASTSIAVVVALDLAFLSGLLLASPPVGADAFTMVCWLPVEAILSRLLWWSVVHSGQAADRAAGRAEGARTAAAVATAARAAEREYLATLHDTAANTLLIVGLGEVSGAAEWLRSQAHRDLMAFDHPASDRPGRIDLVQTLRGIAIHSRMKVITDLPEACWTPARLGMAVGHAVREALTNVDRHAHTDTAGPRAAIARHQRGQDRAERQPRRHRWLR